MKKLVLVAIVLTICATFAVWSYFQTGIWQKQDESLMAAYGSNSKMIEIDGATFRYQDEGSGDTIILVHGAFGNLNYWDDWAETLGTTHRVIRFDVPPEGISNPDPKGYSHDRIAELIGLLADRLEIESFALAGISRGGTAATLYAGRHPDRITHLFLSNTPLLNVKPQALDIPPKIGRLRWVSSNLMNDYLPSAFWEEFFKINFTDPSRIDGRWVNLYRDMNNRESGAADLAALGAMGANRDEDRNIAAAKAVTAPTLFMLTKSIALPEAEQRKVIALFENEPDVVQVDAGHFPAIELGSETAEIAKDFMETPLPITRNAVQ